MWNPCRSFSTLVGLAVEAIEAITFLLDFSDPADKIWADACDRLVEKEAEEEVAAPADDYLLYELRYAAPRIRTIIDRGLGPGERDGEWIDVDGDRWRYNHEEGSWQNKMSRGDIATTWYNVPSLAGGSLSAVYAPFTEVPLSSPADGLAHSAVPLAGDGPAESELRALSPAGPPTLTCDDFMDAARAAREKGNRIDHPNFAAHWDELADRLEVAAISAAPDRISVKK